MNKEKLEIKVGTYYLLSENGGKTTLKIVAMVLVFFLLLAWLYLTYT
jgi:hypothetical protein